MKNVLVIDDEEAVCWTLDRALTREGYRVAVAASAEQAWGQLARHNQMPDHFEGGQQPLQRRVPKRGFISIHRLEIHGVNVGRLEGAFKAGEDVTVEQLHARNLVPKRAKFIKLLGEGDLNTALKIHLHGASAAARQVETYLAAKAPTVLAFSTGRTLRATVAQVAPMERPQHTVVSLVGTMTLVPLIADAVPLPVIAAGGIMDGRGIAAAFALGAAAASLGTAFIPCPENTVVSRLHREAMLSGKQTPTVLSRAYTGRYARFIRNRFLAEMAGTEQDVPAYPHQIGVTAPLRKAAGDRNDPDFVYMLAGQGYPMSRALPAGELVQTLVRETSDVLATMRALNIGARGPR